MTVSVIIPVYNVKPYLERCVLSVLNQTYKDIDIILVDDGSTDGSGELCDDLASRMPHITTIHQNNQGISAARNKGLCHATGHYVVFLDADDAWLLPDGLEKLMKKAKDFPDVIIFKVVNIWGCDRKDYTQDYDIDYIEKLPNSSEVFKYLILTQQFSMSACFLLVKRELLVNNKIYFPIGYISEDVYWSLHLWQYIQRISILNLNFYGYYHRENSVTTKASIRVYESYDKIFNFWKAQSESGCKNAESIRVYLANMWVNRGYGFYQLEKKEKDTALNILKAHKDILKYGSSGKAKLVRYISNIFGVRIAVTILGYYWRLRKTFEH